jgi:hypothetical protein
MTRMHGRALFIARPIQLQGDQMVTPNLGERLAEGDGFGAGGGLTRYAGIGIARATLPAPN